MKSQVSLVAVLVSALACQTAAPGAVSGQLPEFDATDPRASFDAMAEYLARDGGRWRAENPNFDASTRSPPEFGLWFERHVNGRVLQLQIVVHHSDRTVVSSHGQWIWHPGREEVVYTMTDRGGAVTEGTTTFPNATTFRTDALRVDTRGGEVQHRDDNVVVSETTHRNETFRVDGGQAASQGIYVWRREG